MHCGKYCYINFPQWIPPVALLVFVFAITISMIESSETEKQYTPLETCNLDDLYSSDSGDSTYSTSEPRYKKRKTYHAKLSKKGNIEVDDKGKMNSTTTATTTTTTTTTNNLRKFLEEPQFIFNEIRNTSTSRSSAYTKLIPTIVSNDRTNNKETTVNKKCILNNLVLEKNQSKENILQEIPSTSFSPSPSTSLCLSLSPPCTYTCPSTTSCYSCSTDCGYSFEESLRKILDASKKIMEVNKFSFPLFFDIIHNLKNLMKDSTFYKIDINRQVNSKTRDSLKILLHIFEENKSYYFMRHNQCKSVDDILQSIDIIKLFISNLIWVQCEYLVKERTGVLSKISRKKEIFQNILCEYKDFFTYAMKPYSHRIKFFFTEASDRLKLKMELFKYSICVLDNSDTFAYAKYIEQMDSLIHIFLELLFSYDIMFKLIYKEHIETVEVFIRQFENEKDNGFPFLLNNKLEFIEKTQNELLSILRLECGDDFCLASWIYNFFGGFILKRLILPFDNILDASIIRESYPRFIEMMEEFLMPSQFLNIPLKEGKCKNGLCSISISLLYLVMFYMHLHIVRLILMQARSYLFEGLRSVEHFIEKPSNIYSDSFKKCSVHFFMLVKKNIKLGVQVFKLIERNREYLKFLLNTRDLVDQINSYAQEMENLVKVYRKDKMCDPQEIKLSADKKYNNLIKLYETLFALEEYNTG